MTDKHGNAVAQLGNCNAAKPKDQRRQPITIRLPADLIENLRAGGNVTEKIEAALRKVYGW